MTSSSMVGDFCHLEDYDLFARETTIIAGVYNALDIAYSITSNGRRRILVQKDDTYRYFVGEKTIILFRLRSNFEFFKFI